MFKGCFKGIGKKFKGKFREVSNVLCVEGSFKGVPRKILGCFKEVSWVFEESFKQTQTRFFTSLDDKKTTY